MTESRSFDLDAYLARIRYHGPLEPTEATLEKLHVAHLARIPFENIDIRLGRPVGIDLESIQAKIVRGGRGGYCFEQNTLFAAALRSMGFDVDTLEARVRPPGATATLPRTHMLLRVNVGEVGVIADVGFGGDGPLLPVPLDGTLSEQPEGDYRIHREEGAVHVLRNRQGGVWRDLYAFSLTPALPVDFGVAHHYTSTHPRSPFVNTLTVQRVEPGIRRVLRGRTYTVRRGDEETTREMSRQESPALLREQFGLGVPEDDVLAALGDG